MQNQAGLIIFLFVLFAVVMFLVVIIVVCLNFGEIQEFIKGFFKDLAAQKVAKRLNMVDKGRVSCLRKIKTNPDGSHTEQNFRIVHVFCRSPIRIAILNKQAVQWCCVCELVFPKDEDGGNGDDGSMSDNPVPPSTKIRYLFRQNKK